MEKTKKVSVIFTWAFLLLIATTVSAQHAEYADKTLSPYFFLKSDDPSVDQLPLKSTSVIVNIG